MDAGSNDVRNNVADNNDVMYTSWCSDCGRDTPAGVTECEACAKWWAENPPHGIGEHEEATGID